MDKQQYRLTPEHREQLKPWADRWIANAMSTQKMTAEDREVCRAAVTGLYKGAKLEPPRNTVFVSSPFVLAFAGGFSAATWWASKNQPQAAEVVVSNVAQHTTLLRLQGHRDALLSSISNGVAKTVGEGVDANETVRLSDDTASYPKVYDRADTDSGVEIAARLERVTSEVVAQLHSMMYDTREAAYGSLKDAQEAMENAHRGRPRLDVEEALYAYDHESLRRSLRELTGVLERVMEPISRARLDVVEAALRDANPNLAVAPGESVTGGTSFRRSGYEGASSLAADDGAVRGDVGRETWEAVVAAISQVRLLLAIPGGPGDAVRAALKGDREAVWVAANSDPANATSALGRPTRAETNFFSRLEDTTVNAVHAHTQLLINRLTQSVNAFVHNAPVYEASEDVQAKGLKADAESAAAKDADVATDQAVRNLTEEQAKLAAPLSHIFMTFHTSMVISQALDTVRALSTELEFATRQGVLSGANGAEDATSDETNNRLGRWGSVADHVDDRSRGEVWEHVWQTNDDALRSFSDLLNAHVDSDVFSHLTQDRGPHGTVRAQVIEATRQAIVGAVEPALDALSHSPRHLNAATPHGPQDDTFEGASGRLIGGWTKSINAAAEAEISMSMWGHAAVALEDLLHSVKHSIESQRREPDLSNWYVVGDDMAKLARELGVGDFGLRCATLTWKMWQGGNQWSGGDSFFSFFRHVAKLDIDYTDWDHWEKLSLHSGPRVLHPQFCMISDRPEVLLVDDRNRPHCDTGPFCRWRDGSALYAVHGVRVPAWIIEKPERLTAKHIDDERNAEVRRVMIERFTAERWLRESGAKVVAEAPADHPHVGLRTARLLRKEVEDDEPILMLDLLNSTPEPDGTVKRYFLRVDPNAYGGKAAKNLQAAAASTWRLPDGSLAFERYTDYAPELES